MRVLRTSPAFSATVIATLALGVAATTTAFGIVDGILLRSLPYRDADRLAQLGTVFGGSVSVAAMSAPDAFEVAARTRTLAAVGLARTRPMDLTGSGAPERLTAAAASASFFEALGVAPALGRAFDRESDRRGAVASVILSHGLWRRRFGGERRVIGQPLTLSGTPYTVVGVMPAGFRGPDALGMTGVDLWVPLGSIRSATEDRDDAAFGVVARLADGATAAAANAELDVVGQAIGLELNQGARKFWLTALHDRTIGDAGTQLWLLFGSVAALFLIACANIAGLFVVRATERGREMAIRLAMGASRGRIVRQLLAESALLSLVGGALGVAFAVAALGAFRAAGPTDLPRMSDVGADARVLAFSVGLSLGAGLLFGLTPALDAVRAGLAGGLREATRSLTGPRVHTRLRSVLVVVQISLALTLLTGAALLANSLVRLGRVDPGFDSKDVVWLDVTLPERYANAAARLAFFSDLLEQARAVTGVVDAGAIGGRPLGGGNAIATMQPEGTLPADGQQVPRFPFHTVMPGYFAAMGIPLIDGRDVSDDDGTTRVAVVSRSLAQRFWPGERAVGRRFWMGRVGAEAPLTEVVGVAGDVLQYGLGRAPEPIVYRPAAQVPVPRATLSLIVRHDGRDARQAIEALRAAAWRLDPALPLDRFGTMEGAVHASIGEPRFRSLALAIFSAIAALVAAVGLYATLAWVVRARRRELGIRMVLGADLGAVRGLVLRQGMRLALAGILLGSLVAAAASRLVASMVFGITPRDVPTFAAAAAGMTAIALLASWIPARRAAAVDPVETLRVE